MPLPKQRHNSSRGARRRSGHRKLAAKQLVKCSHCGLSILPHQACQYCGHYKGKEVIQLKAVVSKKKK